MKKKTICIIAICISLAVIIAGIMWGIRTYLQKQDPYWQMAKKLYNVESALQEIDESWELKSLNQVTPYCYQNPDGNTITYYCCTTTYIDGAPSEYEGLNQTALEQVVDIDTLENRRDCTVNDLKAIIGELDGQTYLCWTISPTYSCVLEYTAGSISEADIFRMAESVGENSAE